MIDEISENFIFKITMYTEKQQPKKLRQNLNQDKRIYYSKATPRCQWSLSIKLIKFYKTSLLVTAQLLPVFSRARAKIWSNYTQDKPNTTAQLLSDFSRARTNIWSIDKPNTTAQLLQGSCVARVKIWSNYTQDKTYILQQS